MAASSSESEPNIPGFQGFDDEFVKGIQEQIQSEQLDRRFSRLLNRWDNIRRTDRELIVTSSGSFAAGFYMDHLLLGPNIITDTSVAIGSVAVMVLLVRSSYYGAQKPTTKYIETDCDDDEDYYDDDED
jgi:hypothetical protein